jgi:integrase
MPVYKEEKTNTWRVIYRYTDWKGERKQTSKRGFSTKREAQAWEREQLNKVTADVDMTFASFIDRYTEDMKTRLKENTWSTKEHIIRSKLIPYFGRLKLSNITPQQIITWQNELLNYRDAQGKPYSPVYLRTIQNQLSAIFNHAVRYYRLRENPCKKAGSMGKKKAREMLFWTKEKYLQFAKAIQDKPMAYHAFQMLYWCGIREGELLALTPADFDFDRETVTISKSYQRLKGKDVITDPKTEKSNRTITMPDFLAAEMQEYIGSLYRIQSDDRIFPFTSSFLRHEMERGCKASGVKKIRIHDLRHSAISLLIDMGFSPLAIADRVGHEAIEITYNYAHLFPSKQQDMAKQLSQAMQEAPEPPDNPPHTPQLTLIKNDSAA